MPAEDAGGRSRGVDGGSFVADTALDGNVIEHVGRTPPYFGAEERHSDAPFIYREPPHNATHAVNGMQTVRENLKAQGLSAEATNIIMASWKPGTAKAYTTHISRWSQFCVRRQINSRHPNVNDIINFLTVTFQRNVGYECVNTARSALSSLGIVVDGCRAGNHPLVVRFMKGVFNLRPTRPRYTDIWDISPVLSKLRAMHPLHSLSLKELSLKLVTLMAITQAARVQTLHLLVLNNIMIEEEHISVQLGGNIKQCRSNFNIQRVQFSAYLKDDSLCVCKTLRSYIARTEGLRQVNGHRMGNLLISYIKPHKPVSRDTIARWIKTVLKISGVDTSKFTAGSVRPAAASKAKTSAVPIHYIMDKAGWSREATFAKFYDKKIVTLGDPFQDAVLDCHV